MDIRDIALKVYVVVDSKGRFGTQSRGEFTDDVAKAHVFEKLGVARSWVTSYVTFATTYRDDALAPDDIPRVVELSARPIGYYNERKRVTKSRLKQAKKQERMAVARVQWNVDAATKEFTKLQETIATLEQDVAQEEDYVAVTQGEYPGR